MSPSEPSPALRKWLHQHQLTGYLRVLATDPWADLEAAYATLNVAEITPEAVRAYLDLPPGGIKDVEMLTHERISAYYGEFSTTSKSYKTLGGHSDLFKEWSVLFMTVAFLQQNAHAMPRGKGSLLIAEFEGTRIDWAEWTAESILREIAANRKKPVPALAHWLAIFSPPPPGATKTASRPPSQGTSGGAHLLTAHDDVYVPEPLPEITEPEEQLKRERKRKGKAPMELPVSTGVPPYEPVPFTIFRDEREPTAQQPAEEDEPVLVIPTQLPATLYEDDSGERETRPKTPWAIGQRVQITPREWDADTPMEQPVTQELPRTPGRISPTPELDAHVEILVFDEEEDQQGRTISIKQRKKKKAHKRKRESGHTSEVSGKKKKRKIEAGGTQPMEVREQVPITAEPEPARPQPEDNATAPIMPLVDYPDEEQGGRQTPEQSTIPDPTRLVEEIRAPTASVPVVAEQSRSGVQAKAERSTASIDQIVMLAEQLLEATCKLKEEHDEETEEIQKTAELNKRLGRAEEALKRIRAERDASLRANEELGRAMQKKDAEIKKVRTELTKAQAYVTDYLMKEEELVRNAERAKEEVDRMRNEQGKHTGEINSLHRRLQQSKKERKEETVAFEQQLRKLRQELRDKEKTWSSKETKFTEDVINLTTDMRKLKAEVEEKRAETERLSTELTKKNNGFTELQNQLHRVKTESQLQYKQLVRRKELIDEANKRITELVASIQDGSQKAMMHVKKIIERFRQRTEADIEEATTTTLQQWCAEAAELQVLRADKANRDLKGSGFWKLDKANAEAVQANLKADFQRIAFTHHEEITKLLAKQREYVKQIAEEALTVAEPIRLAAEDSILHILDDEEENPAESG